MNKELLHMITIAIVSFGALNASLANIANIDILQLLNNITLKSDSLVKILYVIIGLSALYIMYKKDSYLPFLGNSVIPPALPEYSPEKKTLNIEVDISDPNAEKVLYWASNSNDKSFDDYKSAYGNFENSGIVKVNNGKAVLGLSGCPASYKVKKYGISETTLPKHVHYRVLTNSGMASEVLTKNLDC